MTIDPASTVLVAFECSGRVREALRSVGVRAVSCDLLPAADGGPHIVGDVRDLLPLPWLGIIAHPPCTRLAVSGARWWPLHMEEQAEAVALVREVDASPSRMVAIENPIGALSRLWRPYDQCVQPWWFGDAVQKSTCLWLRGLPPLLPTCIAPRGEFVTYPSGKRLPKWYADAKSADKEKTRSARSVTFQGFAAAIAMQWGPMFLPTQSGLFNIAPDLAL
jgi:hypothetical protein